MVRPQNRRNPGPKQERIRRVYELAALEGMSYREIAAELGVSPATVTRAMKIAIDTIPEMERSVIRRVVFERNRHLWRRGKQDLDNCQQPAQMIQALTKVNDQLARLYGVNAELPAEVYSAINSVLADAAAEAEGYAAAKEQEILSRDRNGDGR